MSGFIVTKDAVDEFRIRQEKNIDIPFPKGVAFSFIKRFLGINKAFSKQLPVEVVIKFNGILRISARFSGA
jgi:5'-nucleotidase